MKTNRVAILDLGTNTFNLLIAEIDGKAYRLLHSSRIAVKLGRGGINKNTILPDAFQRGIDALATFANTFQSFGITMAQAFATSAIRSATNGTEFIERISQFGVKVEIIDGNREAELIYLGVRETIDIPGKFLILDIGGGSNEFIIADKEQVYWKQSFPLGMARIIETFKLSDPITNEQTIQLENYFIKDLQPLWDACLLHKPQILVGDEGSFETLFAIAQQDDYRLYPSFELTSREFELTSFFELHNTLLHSTIEQRQQMRGLDPIRIEMIVPAVVFINCIISRLKIQRLIVSFYSLKDGALISIIKTDK